MGCFMSAAASLTSHPQAKRSVDRKELLALAKFCDGQANAVSFYSSLASTPDNAHRQEIIATKKLIQDAMGNFAPEPAPASLATDLQAVLGVVDEIQLNPARLRVIFACGGQRIWEEFDVSATGSLSYLQVGRRFHLAPLMMASQSVPPYCVALLETGKARAFVVRGTEIQEVPGRLAVEDLSLHAEDSRVGWTRHIDGRQVQHERGYFKRLSHQLLDFLSEQQISRLVVGCREDLWGEMEPELAPLEKDVLIGRFHLPNFDVGSAEVLQRTTPMLGENERMRTAAVLRDINEEPSRGALGLNDVLNSLLEGRVQKLVLGQLPNQTVSECQACGQLLAEAGKKCACGSDDVRYLAAEEGLIRQALLTDAEIMFVEPGAVPGFIGAAALLRY